jgi:Tol biopolymer transport system component
MTLPAGKRLGPYEILAPLGAGGMGEVYKARDTRLDRTVAIKVLPSHLSHDPDLRQRFEREARAISSLSHPHICALYDVGSEDGLEYLVMELLEGETLAERLTKGTLPLAQVLRFGVEIAEALGAAHRQGIVHRDLKPGNVMLTKSGVKLLDFGLAKVRAAEQGVTSLSIVPTTPDHTITQKGAVLGTFRYMAPEQLEGKEADSRTDIFALGAVLHEMATGRKAFSGSSQASLIGSILKDQQPPVSTLQPMAPPAFDHVVDKCLAKEPDERWQSAADVASELRWIAKESSHASAVAPIRAGRRSREAVAWAAFLLVSVAALALWLRSSNVRPAPAAVVHASIPTPEGLTLATGGGEPHGPAALSPDGRFLVFPASSKDRGIQLWIRPLDAAEARPLPGTEQASYPFWSPDSKSVGFFAGSKLKTVSAAGGEPLVLADAPSGRGGAWSRGGTILYAPAYIMSGLYRVPAAGGAPQAVTRLDATKGQETHRFPSFLPDGRHFLYHAGGLDPLQMDYEGPWDGIYVGSLDGGADRFLVRSDSEAQYTSSHILFMRQNTLFAVPFDPRSLAISGEPSVVVEDAERDLGRSKGGFTVSEGGTLAYHPGTQTSWTQLTWLDRSGRRLGSVGEPGILGEPALSPDGKRAAVSVLDAASRIVQIWLYDLASGAGSRFTLGSSTSRFPVWSSDGSRVYFSSNRKGRGVLYVKFASGAGEEAEVFRSEGWAYPTDCSRDGRFLVFTLNDLPGGREEAVWVLPLFGEKKATALAGEKMKEPVARISPDSRWIAYESKELGRQEIHVAAFPGSGGKWQVSTGGGAQPRWRRDGKELYFVSSERELMAVDVRAGTSFEFGRPRPLFTLPSIPNTNMWFYDVAADGDRFLVVYPVVTKQAPLALVLNWTAALRK